ncbi:alkaline ceramidase 3 isoform X1 [Electrophorus electricus]|uniref:alkaline ceramidase 3 isoform X1 n=1 Tax=Electrophorus electricus TaxID=8005 RepID=UPI0015D096C1|nr:alkaline ceramidase 3 isoform X1 [Electrophorus electricus]
MFWVTMKILFFIIVDPQSVTEIGIIVDQILPTHTSDSAVFFHSVGNTVSNLIMILPPIYGALQTFRDGLEIRYVWSFLGLAAVGTGSWCFHMTLQYEMQLLDELPMIYSCCIFVYCLYECFKQENAINYFPITLLLFFSIIVSGVYLLWKEPVFHQVMYGVLVACLVIRSVFIVAWVYPWLRALCYASLSIFLLGFVLWNIDNIFCDSLRAARQRLPPVVGAVTQLHAWWHILTGLGSYLHILLSLQIRSTYLKYRPKIKFLCAVWPTFHVESQKAS